MNTETLQKKGGLSYSFLAEHHQELAYAASSWAGFEQPQNTQAVASAVVADVMKHENHHEIDEIKNLEAVKSTKLRELSEAQFQCQMSGDKVNAGIISLAILVLSGAQGSAIKAALDAASIAIKSTTGGSDGPQTPEQKMQEALNHIRQDSHDLHTIFHKMHDEHHIHFNKKDLALSDKLNDQIEELTKQLEKDAENKALQKKLDDLVKQAAEVDQRLIEQAKAQGAKDEQVQELIKQAQDKMEDRKRESDKLSEEQIKVHKAELEMKEASGQKADGHNNVVINEQKLQVASTGNHASTDNADLLNTPAVQSAQITAQPNKVANNDDAMAVLNSGSSADLNQNDIAGPTGGKKLMGGPKSSVNIVG